MKLTDFDQQDPKEICSLFDNTFSDSEGMEEGKAISELVQELIENTKRTERFGFIAELNKQIVGCIFFSRFSLADDKTAFILSPVAISTEHQKKGIGQALINYGIEQMKSKAVDILLTYGDPAYYSKFGFQQITEDIIQAPCPLSQPEGWLAQSLSNNASNTSIAPISGPTQCVEALSDPKYW